jgi:hypothetical protein
MADASPALGDIRSVRTRFGSSVRRTAGDEYCGSDLLKIRAMALLRWSGEDLVSLPN